MFASRDEMICTCESEYNIFLPLCSMATIFFTIKCFLIFLEIFSKLSAQMTSCTLLLS